MKRFTETQKWDDKWFRKLPPNAKLFWDWACAKCDQAGVIDPDFDLAAFQIGMEIDDSILDYFEGRIEILPSGKLHIVKFIQFQYGKLSRTCKPHMPVFVALERHGLTPDGVMQNDSFKETVDESMRHKVINRDGLFCAYYGVKLKEDDAVIDHIIPRSSGGKATMDNLVVASFKANSRKWDYSPQQFCEAAGLDVDAVFERLSKATGKPIEAFMDSSNTLLGRVKEKEKEKEKDQEREKEEDHPKKSRGSLEEFRAYGSDLGLGINDADYLHAHLCENGWKRGKEPIKDWKATMRKWKTGKYFPSQKGESTKPKGATPDGFGV